MAGQPVKLRADGVHEWKFEVREHSVRRETAPVPVRCRSLHRGPRPGHRRFPFISWRAPWMSFALVNG